MLPQQAGQLPLKFLAAQLPPGQSEGGHAGPFRPLQGVGPGYVGHHQNDLPMEQLARTLCVQQGLKIGAAAGHQHGNAGQHRTTFSWPVTISPTA